MTETALRAPLSLQQDFLRMVDHGDDTGPFGSRYTIVGGWRLRGPVDVGTLRASLTDVVTRHESLRTRLVVDGGQAFQTVLDPSEPELVVRDLSPAAGADRTRATEDFLNEVESGTFGMDRNPLLRAVLGRFDDTTAVLALMAHHTAADGWSMQVIMRDVAACYAARRQGRPADLPPARQYREYVAWQRENADSPATAAARRYWRDTLRGAQVVPTPTDLTRADGTFVTSWHRFWLDDDLRAATVALANRTTSTVFMVVLAAYLDHLRRVTGESDLVVPTFTPGRTPAWTAHMVGSFYHFVPLRTDLTGCTDPLELIARARTTCLAAYRHELPFADIIAEAPEVMDAAVGPNAAACVLQVTQSPMVLRDEQIGELTYRALRRRLVSAPVGSQIPDGALLGLEVDPDGGIVGSVGYTTNLFLESTAAGMAADIGQALGDFVERAQRGIGDVVGRAQRN
ncbi:condensation domain-containing protein [Solwaraspora sp. WMMA2056]|uniref:condensation domain-containing protein n=1 Tax=Solwaraspora sp. WMMA2056 TaxID=3015161 RepID=UPI00259B0046|nr:condensation domain-containing protein [Solwaraspora sp. WMMA2056]WJK42583.1 condensation domain-containing protein [Solwaraspora sp. WMMA2056]